MAVTKQTVRTMEKPRRTLDFSQLSVKLIFPFLHSFTHQSAFKVTQIMNRHCHEDIKNGENSLPGMSDLSGP